MGARIRDGGNGCGLGPDARAPQLPKIGWMEKLNPPSSFPEIMPLKRSGEGELTTSLGFLRAEVRWITTSTKYPPREPLSEDFTVLILQGMVKNQN